MSSRLPPMVKQDNLSLHEEIQHLLVSLNVPDSVTKTITEAMVRVEQNHVAPGIQVGEPAPAFVLPDPKGQPISLEDRLERGPAVLSFFRGAWCPICNLQLRALERALPRIRASNGSLIAIHPDYSLTGTGQTPGFDVLADHDQSVIQQYRLQFTLPKEVQQIYTGLFDTDISKHNADGTWNLPVPGTFIIDRAGIVRERHVTTDFTRRMEPDAVVAALDKL